MLKRVSIRTFLKNFEKGRYDVSDRKTQIAAGWYDCFCDESELRERLGELVRYLKQIVNSPRINLDTMYVSFQNKLPMVGDLYDEFHIGDLKSGVVCLSVTPKSGMKIKNGRAEVHGEENGFCRPLVEGTWEDVLAYFSGAGENSKTHTATRPE